MDNSGYSRLQDAPITPPSRVHTAYPREKHQKVECAPQPGDPSQDSSLPRPSFAEQRFELPSTLLSPLKAPEPSDRFKNPFLNLLPNSPLNPRSNNFSPGEWISNLVAFMGQDPRRYPRRSAGFSVENLSVHAFRKPTDYQKNVANIVFEIGAFTRWLVGSGKQKVQILKSFDCLVEHGEMLLILGRPGSGVSTLLKTISGDTHGLFIDPGSSINYQGVSITEMHTRFRGEAIYLADSDVHFPNLTVGETLLFAATARAPPDLTFPGVTRQVYAENMRDVTMATLGLRHVEKVLVGNDYIKGISGGERKKVSIAEVVLSGCTLQCWDNSTRGLDSAYALEFCKMLRHSTTLGRTTACVSLYQTPQSAYDLFDKVTVLYEGRQIYFGSVVEARQFFIEMGFVDIPHQTTADFLTSLTSPDERTIQPGFEFRVPRTPEEFVMVWKTSRHYARLMLDLEAYENEYPFDGSHALDFAAARRSQQAKYPKSAYTLCSSHQVLLCIGRGFQRLRNDINFTVLSLAINSLMAMIISIVFYDLPGDTSSIKSRIAYAYESLIINEFSGCIFQCTDLAPSGPSYIGTSLHNRVCSVIGSIPGFEDVLGTVYLELKFGFQPQHLWRNMSILFAFMAFFMASYLIAATYLSTRKTGGEVLLFQRGHKRHPKRQRHLEIYSGPEVNRYGGNGDPITRIQRQTSTFQWRGICLDIKTVDGTRRILDHVDGWVKPGTLTAVMGPAGAGKTSLLDILASRSNIGIVSGEMFVDGCIKEISFQRKVGYVQQQDFHLSTATVREALQFSAIMRQSSQVTKREKFAYVEEIIKLLEMDVYADAVVGVPGEGLNIEQRKKLTIGIELAAKPKLLFLLDEPTSGLDSSTAWDIVELLRRITAHGQAILCTIVQPSAALFQRFDSLLILGPVGRPIYFGRLGENCKTVKDYFEANGADPCPPDGNVAEWIMQTIGCTTGSKNAINWPEVWKNSHELVLVHRKLDHMRKALCARSSFFLTGTKKPPRRKEFATPFLLQVWECSRRTNLHYWRTPSYIYSKIAVSLFYALFVGFSFFKDKKSLQDLQNQILGVFMLLTLTSSFVPQLLPNLLVQRALFEARECHAKMYSWPAFIISNILVELAWSTLVAVIISLSCYYPMGMYRNALLTKTMLERNGVMLLLIWVYLIYASTFGYMVQVGLELTEMAGILSNAVFLLSLMFCGIISAPTALPQVWGILWRLSPFTYLADGMLSVGLANDPVTCSQYEFLHFEPVTGSSCGSYMASYIHRAGGYLINPSAKSRCVYCPLKDSNELLAGAGMSYDNRWRNFCVMWAYVGFNIIMTLLIYWLVRVRKGRPVKDDLRGASDPKASEVRGVSNSERSFVKVRGYQEESPQSRKHGRSDEMELFEM
ncbi:hypothetical protein DSL72_007131 [Monilinia vaccinii-corymbosi]|uniref:ABC transporter domain-containing protein n=1 Tax=Monilinia vaccinii-corymbosi TaxID=61207 RepID=A0A8A3PKS0_9HELO|nr:hypothetical protein DSL72_007131 [Monilinia vaccinii-corymbosi]